MRNLILALFLSQWAFAQSPIATDLVRLRPTSVPSTCRNGDLRVDSGASNVLKICRSNAWTKLVESAAIVNADISGSAAIAYSKLNLTGSILNADIGTGAAIARSKLATGSANHVLINGSDGLSSSEAQLAISRGGTGQSTANAAFGALSPQTTKGDLIGYNGTSAIRLAGGSDTQVLTYDSTTATGWKWASPSAPTSVPYFNYLVNAEFRFAQAINPNTLTTLADGGYGPDQWYMLDSNAGSTSQYQRVDGSGTSIGSQYTSFYGQFRQSNAAAKQIMVCQPLTNARTIPLRGKQVTFAHYARTDTTEITTLRTCIGEWTGTADTITKDVVSSWASTPTWVVNFACDNTPADQTISSSWTQLSTTATISTSANNVIVCVWTPNTEAQNDDFYLAQTQLVEGSSALSWKLIQRSAIQDYIEAAHFYEKSYDVDTAPASSTSVGIIGIRFFNMASTAFSNRFFHSFQVYKRSAPSMTYYTAAGASGSWDQGTGTKGVTTISSSGRGFALEANSAASAATDWFFAGHFTADSRL